MPKERFPREIHKGSVWYILLQFAVPSPYAAQTLNRHIRIAKTFCRSIGAFLEICNFESSSYSGKRYIFRFPNYKRDDSRALRLAEAFSFVFAVSGGPIWNQYNYDYVLPIPKELVFKNNISLKALLDYEEQHSNQQNSFENIWFALNSSFSTSEGHYRIAWKILPILLSHEDLFEAARFLKASQDGFFVYPGQISELLEVEDSPPITLEDQTRFETALHNAFKSIEAVIGDPPKNETKFFARLRGIGIDPHENFGSAMNEEIHHFIRVMNDARDKKSAHGSTRNRTILVGELFKYQSCARYVVRKAIETALGSRLFFG